MFQEHQDVEYLTLFEAGELIVDEEEERRGRAQTAHAISVGRHHIGKINAPKTIRKIIRFW
jgi:hypothetical protein